ncbi:MAG: RidA family protein [Candidatus Dormibacteria bacterium]
MSIDERLASLGITLPAGVTPLGAYLPAVRSGSLVFLSGHVSTLLDPPVRGRLGGDVDLETGRAAARGVAIALLGTLRAAIGSLDQVQCVVRLTGMVASTPEFTDQSRVIDGASELLTEVFGESGRHARAAFGVVALPAGAALEIDLVVEATAPADPG